jgi:hypothetical protein
MKRFLLLFALLFAVPAAFAQSSGNVLLTDEGIVYDVAAEWSHEHPDVHAASASYLVLTVREPETAVHRMVVPATLTDGSNSDPALAYDSESGTVFIFWQYSVNAMSSELRFISLDRNGNWSLPKSFETAAYRFRRNLRIGLTHFAGDRDDTSSNISSVPEINVHATWWESSASGEYARYAMLTLHRGEVAIQVRDLADFVHGKDKPYEASQSFNNELFRHPAIFESSGGDSVDVVFGNVQTNVFHRVTLTPIGNARVRIPVGKSDKGFNPPDSFEMSASSRIDAISPNPDRLIFFFQEEGAVRYIVYRNNEWSTERKIRLDEGMTRDMAVTAMRGLVGAH